jgi:hypothetical protein
MANNSSDFTSLGKFTAKMAVRARAVDMLGRQQIAGIPSAVHELFKNAYDAFARRVEVDVLRKQGIFLLRDDGFGMTKDDFLTRWLTIGTESKVGKQENTAHWLGEHGSQPRRILGEKGIGRLAIAVIGPTVLVLTRANRADGLHDLVAALIHWGLFEIPGIDLDRIAIPIRTFKGGSLPEKEDIDEMVDNMLTSLKELGDGIPESFRSKIKSDLELMRFSPRAVYDGISLQSTSDCAQSPTLLDDGFGTHFLIRPYNSVLELDLEEEGKYPDTRPSKLQTLLAGFSNTMFPDIDPPPVHASFRDHRRDGELRDLIDERAFLSPSDYQSADHLIEGEFDSFGQFSGSVRIYGQPPFPYTLSYPRMGDSPLRCGSFRVRFGYSQGWAHQSLLNADDHAVLSRKLADFGGLYVYRDGIRVLPYGDIEHDFLRIEQRRNKAAKDWFFSFRRMFGAVLIDVVNNSALQEKAGREGFQENLAFRQFRDVLENFLMTLAKDFFRKDAPLGEQFNRMRDEMDAQVEVLRKREKQVSFKKAKLQADLDNFFERIDRGDPKKDVEIIESDFDQRFDRILLLDNPDEMGRDLQAAESDLRRQLESMRQKHRIIRPRGIGLSKSGEADWARYRVLTDQLETQLFSGLETKLDGRVAGVLRERGAAINKKLLLRDGFNARKDIVSARVRENERAAKQGLEQAQDQIRAGIQASFTRFHQDVQNAFADFERTDISQLDEDAIVGVRSRIQSQLDRSAEREGAFLGQLREQLDSLTDSVRAGFLPDDVNAALEGQNVALREDLDDAMYWAQVGMALGIVQHEFDAVARQVKKGIRSLKPWADRNPALQELFRGLHSGFSHLEDYLRLFSSLDRRLHRQETQLLGGEIAGYLRNVFDDRFDRHGIRLESTSAFLSDVISVMPSTIYPVFINIIDNACYWLRNVPIADRWIKLDRNHQGIIVINGGLGIEARLSERIFDFGFSEKPNGRGMGLAIARRALRRDGFDLSLLNPGLENQPTFLISIPSTNIDPQLALDEGTNDE